LLIVLGDRCYRQLHGGIPDVFLKFFVSLLRHFSKHVLESGTAQSPENTGLLEEGIRYVKSELGLPVLRQAVQEGNATPSLFFCDYIHLLAWNKSLEITESGDDVILPVAELAECFRNDVGIFDFDRIRTMLMQSPLGKEYDPTGHRFVLNREPFETNRERLERIYAPFLRR